MTHYTHIREDIRAIAEKSNEDRINYIQSEFWISYPRSMDIIKKFHDLKNHPKVNRMPNYLLVGETNNGKTAILNKFIEENNQDFVIDEGFSLIKSPIVSIQTPPSPDERRLYNEILKEMNVPHKLNERLDKKYYQLSRLIESTNTRVLILDEIHSILSGTYKKQREFMTLLKYMSNDLKIGIIVAGTREARIAINTDPQIANRFSPITLPKWKLDTEFIQLLYSFEWRLTLRKKSGLYEKENFDLAKKIFYLSEGILGELSTILKMAAIQAITSGNERITSTVLDQIDYDSPTKRPNITL